MSNCVYLLSESFSICIILIFIILSFFSYYSAVNHLSNFLSISFLLSSFFICLYVYELLILILFSLFSISLSSFIWCSNCPRIAKFPCKIFLCPFNVPTSFFEHFIHFQNNGLLEDHFILSLPQPLNQPFPQEALVLVFGNQDLSAKCVYCSWGVIALTEDITRKICIYTHTYIHIYIQRYISIFLNLSIPMYF